MMSDLNFWDYRGKNFCAFKNFDGVRKHFIKDFPHDIKIQPRNPCNLIDIGLTLINILKALKALLLRVNTGEIRFSGSWGLQSKDLKLFMFGPNPITSHEIRL